jgi:hypothetical protein
MFSRKSPIFSDLGPMKYELITLWGLDSGPGIFIMVFAFCLSSI